MSSIKITLMELYKKVIYKYLDILSYIGVFFKTKDDVHYQAAKNLNGVDKSIDRSKHKTSHPCSFTYIELEFIQNDAKELFEDCLKNVPHTKDFSYLNFKDNKIYIRGKCYVAPLFGLSKNELNKLLDSNNRLLNNWVILTQISALEWKNLPDDVKVIF